MIMAVKRQIQLLNNPRHLVMITLNHLDAMQDYTNNADNKKSIYLAHEHLINVSMPNPEHDISFDNLKEKGMKKMLALKSDYRLLQIEYQL